MRPHKSPDEFWMQAALALAAKGEGLTRPNPPVGAVIVKNGRTMGEGYHPKAGLPHAEIFALRQAGARARGATLYVTLEPCCTSGRTPPCTDALIASGIKRVVYGCVDPSPVHAGRADRILKSAGIEVTRPVLREACEELIAPFAMRILHKRPLVTLKLACSLDGKIADHQGGSRWITGPAARAAVQALRRRADAIMVGAGTVRQDNPSLLPRPALGRRPWRVVIAGTKPLPVRTNLLIDEHKDQTLVYHIKRRAELANALRNLADRDIMHVVCEGGGVLAHELIAAGLVDRLWMFYAPIVLGSDAQPAVAGKGWRLNLAPAFHITRVESWGKDVLVVAKKKRTVEHFK